MKKKNQFFKFNENQNRTKSAMQLMPANSEAALSLSPTASMHKK